MTRTTPTSRDALPSSTPTPAMMAARARAADAADVPVFCIPYAGGSAHLYHDWRAHYRPLADIRPVELPGRGARYGEPACDEIDRLVATLAAELRPQLDVPFALFGHSMGALVAFELTRLLRDRGWPLPCHLFVSGSCAPHRRPRQPIWHDAPLPEFIGRLKHYNGAPEAALANAELMDAALPFLRADFRIVQCYRYEPSAPLAMPITALGGLGDPDVPIEALDAWAPLTTGPFGRALFAGDHFFLRDHAALVVTRIADSLRPLVEDPS